MFILSHNYFNLEFPFKFYDVHVTGPKYFLYVISAVRLMKSRVMILPVQAVAEDIFIWTVRPSDVIVNDNENLR